MNVNPLPPGASGATAGPSGPALTLLDAGALVVSNAQLLRATVRAIQAGQAVLELPELGTIRVEALPGMRPGMTLALNVRPTSAGGVTLQLAAPLPAAPRASVALASGPSIAGQPSVSREAQPPAVGARAYVAGDSTLLRTGPATITLSSSAGDGSAGLSLRVGQQVSAQVLAQPAPGRALVQIEKTVIEARTDQALPSRSSLSLQVRQISPEIVLGLSNEPVPTSPAVPTARASAEILRNLPGGPAEGITQLGKTLRERLDAPPVGETVKAVLAEAESAGASPTLSALASRLRVLVPAEGPPTAEQMQRFVREGGLHFEAKLAAHAEARDGKAMAAGASEDVKGLALRALAEAPEGSAQAATVSQHLRSIEAQQSANLLALVRGDPILLAVPMLNSAGEFTTMRLAVQSEGGNQAEEEPSFGLLMHLEMATLGEVRIDARFGAAGISVVFYVSESAGASLRSELSALREALGGMGAPASLAVRAIQELPREQRHAFAALESGVPRSGTGLDVMG